MDNVYIVCVPILTNALFWKPIECRRQETNSYFLDRYRRTYGTEVFYHHHHSLSTPRKNWLNADRTRINSIRPFSNARTFDTFMSRNWTISLKTGTNKQRLSDLLHTLNIEYYFSFVVRDVHGRSDKYIRFIHSLASLVFVFHTRRYNIIMNSSSYYC